MKLSYFILLSLQLFCNYFLAQTVILGKVLDDQNQLPIAFVSVGVLNKSIGTVSDEFGNFQLPISETESTDTIKISAIGYKSYEVLVSKAKANYNSNKQGANTIILKRTMELLPEIVIKPKKIKKIILGNDSRSKNIDCLYFPQGVMRGYEASILLKYKKQKHGYIENLNFNIKKLERDSIIFRVNLYEVDKMGIPQENILSTPIYVKGKKGDEMLSVSFPANDFFIKKDTYLSLEWIDANSEGIFSTDCSFFGSCYSRYTSQAKWEHIPIGKPSFWATVWYEK